MKVSSDIQSIIFDKKVFTQRKAVEWLYKHGFYITKPVDETKNTYRYRQIEPKYFQVMRTIKLTDGIKAVLGFY